MDKNDIIIHLEQKHEELFFWLENQSDEQWLSGPEGRWTVGQHILHLIDSIQKLNGALRYPKFLIRKKFGVSNRPTRSYDQVAKRYEERLAENLDRARDFNQGLKKPTLKERKRMLDSYQIQNKKLQYKTKKLKDKHLDTLLLSHPLMGKMTLREVIMWTIHHTEHHLQILKNDYSS